MLFLNLTNLYEEIFTAEQTQRKLALLFDMGAEALSTKLATPQTTLLYELIAQRYSCLLIQPKRLTNPSAGEGNTRGLSDHFSTVGYAEVPAVHLSAGRNQYEPNVSKSLSDPLQKFPIFQ
ncbi:hypothetical protein [Spirosoma gilvum]